MATYIALLHKEEDSNYGVSFPDFPGCVTAGRTLEEARELAAEALGFHLQGLVEDGEAIPEPSSLDVITALPAALDSVAFLVEVKEPSARYVRLNMTIPESALRVIDAYAERRGISRSKLFADAALARVQNEVAVRAKRRAGARGVVTVAAKRSGRSSRDVVRDGSGWASKKPGAKEPASRHKTQRAAENAAKQQVRREGGGEVRVHDRKGRIRDSDTVAPGRDPNPPKES